MKAGDLPTVTQNVSDPSSLSNAAHYLLSLICTGMSKVERKGRDLGRGGVSLGKFLGPVAAEQ